MTRRDKTAETELQFTGLTKPPCGVLPAPPLVRPTQCVFFWTLLISGLTQPTAPSPPVPTLPLNWIKVPQRNYDHGRKQWNFKASEPIYFSVNGLPGMNMRDALRKTFTGLDDRDDPVLQETSGAISCRLLVGLL